ncbi:MAG: hydroxyphenylacetyl-CoA thioesterase PaaI [Paracoccaceae bacterium]
MTPQNCAERCAEIMWASDHASKGLGIIRGPVGPGVAEMSLTIQKHHLNGHGICHGGFIFTLADSAFAFACNSYNQVTVAQETTITFLAPGTLGEVLIASAEEVLRTGRSGVYDVMVRGADQRKIALFRGLSRTIKGKHFDDS